MIRSVHLLYRSIADSNMPFTDVFSLSGQYLTYRDFWTLVLGVYAGVVILTGTVLSVLATKYTKSPSSMKEDASYRKRFKAISWSVGFLYALIMFVLALCNGLFVFGGSSIWIFLGALLGVQLIFTLIAVFVPTPYLAVGIITVSNWYIAGSIFFLIQLPSMFDYAPANLTWLTSVASSIPMGIMAAVSYIQFTNKDVSIPWKNRFSSAIKKWGFWLSISIILAISIVLAFFLAGTCISIYGPNADGSWVPFAGTVRWNSRMMRSISRGSPCPGPGPCHVYLTAGPDLTSSVFVNVHLPLDTATNLTVAYTVGNGTGASVVATEFDVPLLDKNDDRQVFSAYLSNLPEASEISFSLSINGNTAIGDSAYYFKTANSNGPVKFVVAGDGGITDQTTQIITQMIATKPDVGFIGGDVAYDNGFLSCACVWDDFISIWESQKIDGKYLVPISLAVGNHDVGVNDNNVDAFAPMSSEQCNPESILHARPLFFAWFPYETTLSGEITPICQRTTMRVHTVGNLANMWVLDTAYTVSAQANVDYVNSIMGKSASSSAANFAVYHVPLYTANINDQDDGVYLQQVWPSGIFDKYNFTTCFENHAHVYKRTKPLINNTVVSSGGTVYMGDGKMGVAGMAVPGESKIVTPSSDNVFANTGTEYHFFSVSIESVGGKVHIDALNEIGTKFDQLDF